MKEEICSVGKNINIYIEIPSTLHISFTFYFFGILLIFINSKLHTFFINKNNSHKQTDKCQTLYLFQKGVLSLRLDYRTTLLP